MSEKLNPPKDIDAEEAVVGSCLIDADAIFRINPPLTLKDFYSERNGLVYDACASLKECGVSINQITVARKMAQKKTLETCGGAAYLSHLISICPTSLDVDYYADIVRNLSINRILINAGEQIIKLGQEASSDLPSILNKADELLLSVRKCGVPSPIVTPQDRVEILFERYSTLNEAEAGVAIKTGIRELDYRLGGGFYNGDMIILGARPGVGKTTFMQTIANYIAKTETVLFCSAEMTVEGLADRDVASIVGTTTNRIRLGDYDDKLYIKITSQALEELKSRQIYFYKDSPLTTDKILQAGIAMQLRYGLNAIFVDYLGMLDDEYGRSQYERIGFISRKLKQIAYKLNVPLFIAHQLNRGLEKQEDKRPVLSDLRDSGRIEEDADIVMFLYRDSYYQETSDDEENVPTELIIAKQRQGESNKTVPLMFNKKTQTYFGLNKDYNEGVANYE